MAAMTATSSYPHKIRHPPAEALDLATIMRTLGDSVRLEIVRRLGDGRPRPRRRTRPPRPPPRLGTARRRGDRRPRACNELSGALGIPPSTGSYHLRLLREAGVTRPHAQGTPRAIRPGPG